MTSSEVKFTLIVVLAVVTLPLELHTTVGSLPTLLTLAGPLSSKVGFADTLGGTGLGTAFESAVDSVPPCDTQARAVLTLAVEVTTGITASVLTSRPGPAIRTDTGCVFAPGWIFNIILNI